MVLKNTSNTTHSERLFLLSQLDLDYSSIHESFSTITEIAAKVSGCRVSLLNFIDQDTQWSIASYGIEILQTPRKDTICQFTMEGEKELDAFEVMNLSADERFKELPIVKKHPDVNYYYGLPIYFDKRVALGTLCVMDVESTPLSEEKKELLKLLVKDIEERLLLLININDLEEQLYKAERIKNKLAHDIRGPLGGIIGLSELAKSEGLENTPEEMLNFFNLIHQSSSTMMELSSDIMAQKSKGRSTGQEKRLFDLFILQKKINQLYAPAALAKSIDFQVEVKEQNSEIKFPKSKLLQILGNLVSNSIKFTPIGGKIKIEMTIAEEEHTNLLLISIQDSGVGMDEKQVASIGKGDSTTTLGTRREKGFGLGMDFVKELIDQMQGILYVDSKPGLGTTIKITIPFI